MRKKVAIVTGSRAEYGLLRSVIRRLNDAEGLETIVMVTGTHLSPDFGMTVDEIEADGVHVSERIEILLSSDSAVGVGKSMGLAMIGFSEALARHTPDMILLLGDRFEIFCAAAAATVARVPIAHIHGGELTLGAMDDAFRHSITKMSYLHLAATAEYRQRIIQMGESPDRVFNVGALGVEAALSLELWPLQRLEADLGVKLGECNFLVTFHPATLDREPSEVQLQQLLNALDRFPEAFVIFTKANADPQGRSINSRLAEYVKIRKDTSVAFANLGQVRYLSLMRLSRVVIGNSSSGIIEAPSFGIPSVTIGDRQSGRVHAESVLSCAPSTDEIAATLRRALSKDFSMLCRNAVNPYEGKEVAKNICELVGCFLQSEVKPKSFYKGSPR